MHFTYASTFNDPQVHEKAKYKLSKFAQRGVLASILEWGVEDTEKQVHKPDMSERQEPEVEAPTE